MSCSWRFLWTSAMPRIHISQRYVLPIHEPYETIERLIQKYVKLLSKIEAVIDQSFLNVEFKDKYRGLANGRIKRLNKL